MTPMETLRDKICIGAGELIGTLLLVFVGCMGCVYTIAGGVNVEQMTFAFGFTVLFCVQIFAHISGAHFNPAVTLAAVILGYVPWFISPIYVVAQVLGGIIGFALLKLVTPARYFDVRIFSNISGTPGICSTVPNVHVAAWQGMIVELMITMVLILLCCSVWDNRNAKNTDSIAIKFGLTIAGLSMAGAPYTCASMNPARSFGPALINNDWTAHWIYWFGPLLGAAIGAGGYRALFTRPEPQPPSDPDSETAPATSAPKTKKHDKSKA